jgi:hypothetical protein
MLGKTKQVPEFQRSSGIVVFRRNARKGSLSQAEEKYLKK